MKFRYELNYDASVEDVCAMLSDTGYREAVCTAVGAVSCEVTVTRDGDGFDLTIDQMQATNDLPAIARSFAGDTTRVVQREEWKSATSGTLAIDTPGKPTSVRGDVRVEPRGLGAVEVFDLELKVKVPLISGKLEKLLAEKLTKGLDDEHQVGQIWLKENR